MKRNFEWLLLRHPFVLITGSQINDGDQDVLSWLDNLAHTWIGPLALLFAVAALVILFRKSKNKHTSSTAALFSIDTIDLKANRAFTDLSKKVAALEERLLDLKRQKPEDDRTPVSMPDQQHAVAETINEEAPGHEWVIAKPSQEVFFAKYADLENGFSRGILTPIQNGEQVYQLLINEDTAILHISDDPKAQKYALTDFSFTLAKPCEWSGQPFKNCDIKEISPGKLLKVGDNWTIQQKVKIEFK